jgi:flagellar motor switch protein FliG
MAHNPLPPAAGNAPNEPDDIDPLDKIAVLFVALGQDLAAEVFKHLGDFEVEEVTQAIANIKHISIDTQDRVLEEYEQMLLAGDWLGQGGIDFARATLENTLGPRKAQEILDRIASNRASGFYMLRNVAPDQVAPFIANEHPQTVALILSQLDSKQAAGILLNLPEKMQSDVAYRISIMENITPTVLKEIEASLEQSLRDVLGSNTNVGGPKIVADILNLTGNTTERQVIDSLESLDPEVAEAVRNLMFVFGDIAKLTSTEIQVLIQNVEQKDLIIALKAAAPEIRDKFFDSMSSRVRTTIEEEISFLGPMRLSEVEQVQLRIVQTVRQLEEQGQIAIARGDDDETYV